MDKTPKAPRSLLEAIRYFADPDRCLTFMVELRWPDGIICPRCGSKEVTFLANARVWKCRGSHPSQKFSIKIGTIMEDSPIGIDKWLPAIWLITNAKNGISSHELHRAIKVTQKTAWFMLHRIRLAMQNGSFDKLSGTVEADETFIGGKARNMHKDKRKVKGTGHVGKAIVMGLLDREAGHVRATVVPGTRKHTLQTEVEENVEPGSEVFTDALASYDGLDAEYVHGVVDHAERYVDGRIHTNGLENFWALLKRCIKGTYINVQPFHLFRYLDEETFRYNARKADDTGRFLTVLASIVGRRLTYKGLIGDAALTPATA